jgi:Cu-Zn family superoxide dismutase
MMAGITLRSGVLAVMVLGLAAGRVAYAGDVTARANMVGPGGASLGTVTLIQTPQGVLVAADLQSLTPGAHGFHIHETGSCDPDFKAAGGHFNPHGASHGYGHEGQPHAGDMPNVYAHGDGTARADVLNALVTLEEGAAGSLFDGDGSAVIVHAEGDSYGDKAGAGDRVACGVIERQ